MGGRALHKAGKGDDSQCGDRGRQNIDRPIVGRRDSAAADSVEMFAAMKSGDIDVKFIPKDDREARVMFTNKTKRPLSVRLPEAFAAVPVLAQRGGAGGMGGMNGGMMGGMNQ